MVMRELDLPIQTVVFYLGTKQLRHIQSVLERGGLRFEMKVVDVHNLPVESFLTAGHLGILADFGGREPVEVIKTILQRIQNLIETPEDYANNGLKPAPAGNVVYLRKKASVNHNFGLSKIQNNSTHSPCEQK